MAPRRVLITGVSSFTGSELASRLERDPAIEYVAGIDTRPPRRRLERTDLIEVDIRDPTLARLLPTTEIDTLVHNQIVRRPGPEMSAQTAHDINVIGSLQLLAACEKVPTLRAIVIRGSAGIYGAEPTAPQFFTEEMARLYPLRARFQRDVGEIENYFETFSRRCPQVTCTMLRYQPAIGPSLDTQATRYLSLPVVPTYLGFDPRLQFIHEDDAIEALVAAVRRPVQGAVNVAPEGTIGLTKTVRRTGKPSIPIAPPLFEPVIALAHRLGVADLSADFLRLLRYGRAVEIGRLTEEVGYRPRFSAVEAVEDYLATQKGRRPAPPLRHAPARA